MKIIILKIEKNLPCAILDIKTKIPGDDWTKHETVMLNVIAQQKATLRSESFQRGRMESFSRGSNGNKIKYILLK